MATARPSQAFTDVQRYLKQRRATGQIVSPRAEKNAWQGYYDSLSANRATSAAIGARTRQLEIEQQRVDLIEQAQENAEDAATVSGIAELGSTAVLGGMMLKDTSLGAKIGLSKAGTTTAVPTTTTKGAAPTAVESAAPAMAAGGPAASLVHPSLPVSTAPAPSAAFSGLETSAGVGGMAATAAPFTATTALSSAGFGAGAGFAGAAIGDKIAGDKGAFLGGAGAGATAGFVVGGPVGAVVGGVVGGLTGVVKGGK